MLWIIFHTGRLLLIVEPCHLVAIEVRIFLSINLLFIDFTDNSIRRVNWWICLHKKRGMLDGGGSGVKKKLVGRSRFLVYNWKMFNFLSGWENYLNCWSIDEKATGGICSEYYLFWIVIYASYDNTRPMMMSTRLHIIVTKAYFSVTCV